jgi:hypothetical protein
MVAVSPLFLAIFMAAAFLQAPSLGAVPGAAPSTSGRVAFLSGSRERRIWLR